MINDKTLLSCAFHDGFHYNVFHLCLGSFVFAEGTLGA